MVANPREQGAEGRTRAQSGGAQTGKTGSWPNLGVPYLKGPEVETQALPLGFPV